MIFVHLDCVVDGPYRDPCDKILHYDFNGTYNSDICYNFAVGIPYGNPSRANGKLCLHKQKRQLFKVSILTCLFLNTKKIHAAILLLCNQTGNERLDQMNSLHNSLSVRFPGMTSFVDKLSAVKMTPVMSQLAAVCLTTTYYITCCPFKQKGDWFACYIFRLVN